MKNQILFLLSSLFIVVNVSAEQIEIEVPNGWVASESGITKGNSELTIGAVLNVGEMSELDYMSKLAERPVGEFEIAYVGEIKDGETVVQVTRELKGSGKTKRSILFICKKGKNKHRLLELFTDDVFAVISGGKAAIGFCNQ